MSLVAVINHWIVEIAVKLSVEQSEPWSWNRDGNAAGQMRCASYLTGSRCLLVCALMFHDVRLVHRAAINYTISDFLTLTLFKSLQLSVRLFIISSDLLLLLWAPILGFIRRICSTKRWRKEHIVSSFHFHIQLNTKGLYKHLWWDKTCRAFVSFYRCKLFIHKPHNWLF